MPKILICGNNETRESLKTILGDLYNLILTEDPKQCLDCLTNAKDIGCLLIDENICVEIIEQLRNQHPDLKIIVTVSRKDIEKAKELVKYLADDYIVKLFRPEDILEKLRKFSI